MSPPKVKLTVLTPLYNRENYIAETIESILKQDFKDFEYIIIDDGSTDNGAKVVAKYQKDSRIKFIQQKNCGESETVNKGWQLAQGEYFAQINSDDPILPGLFSNMISVLDQNKDAVVCYPDFYFIDKDGKRISETVSPDWVFTEALSDYSCYASSPGTFIRKSAFKDWKKIRDKRFRHISDNYMFFNMALRGPFMHIPKFLATWRQHASSISANRYESIPEIEIWYKEFFGQKGLPANIIACEDKTKLSMYSYFIRLLEQADVPNKEIQIGKYLEIIDKLKNDFDFKNLQIGDNDLIGNKFNGHNLHLYLRDNKIDSNHLVWEKLSNDDTTYEIAANRSNRNHMKICFEEFQRDYSLDHLVGPFAYDILYNRLFLEADVVHYHLIHNFPFDIQLLPILSSLKPTIITLHDPWSLSGHCIEHYTCNRWQTGCGDCPLLETPFRMKLDNTALNYEIKKRAFLNSRLHIIVASKFLAKQMEISPMFKNAVIHQIPFGIDQQIFKPNSKQDTRAKMGIAKDSLVIFFRADSSDKKGLEYIEYALRKLKTKQQLVIITVGGKWENITENCIYREFGWITDDKLLAELYNVSDIFLMPSIVESFGMMAIEAMSCAVLPIVLEGTALPDTVGAPEFGVACKRDIDDFAIQVQYYVDNKTAREQRAKKCFDYAVRNYSKEKYIAAIIKVYQEAQKRHEHDNTNDFIIKQLKKHMQLEPQFSPGIVPVAAPKGLLKKAKELFKRNLMRIISRLPHYRKLEQIQANASINNVKIDSVTDKLNSLIVKSKKHQLEIDAKISRLINER